MRRTRVVLRGLGIWRIAGHDRGREGGMKSMHNLFGGILTAPFLDVSTHNHILKTFHSRVFSDWRRRPFGPARSPGPRTRRRRRPGRRAAGGSFCGRGGGTLRVGRARGGALRVRADRRGPHGTDQMERGHLWGRPDHTHHLDESEGATAGLERTNRGRQGPTGEWSTGSCGAGTENKATGWDNHAPDGTRLEGPDK